MPSRSPTNGLWRWPEASPNWLINGPALGARAGIVDPLLLKSYYEDDKERRKSLAGFVAQKPIGLLLRLGKHAHVELESSPSIDLASGYVMQVYRVTSDEGGEPPFSINLMLGRIAIPGQNWTRWRVLQWGFAGQEPQGSVD